MSKVLPVLFAGLVLTAPAFSADWKDEYARLLKTYVTAGGVRYAEWKSRPADVEALETVVSAIGSAPAVSGAAANSPGQLAFYLNAYNAWILRETLARYPVKSVKDPLFSFFLGNRITVEGKKTSFNTLEKDWIRARFHEPRVHFALNCASRSCPPLRNAPYTGAGLEQELEAQARLFINSPRGVVPAAGGAQISKIFDWYAEDFAASGGVLAALNQRLNSPLAGNAKLSFQDYNWNLNEAK